MEWFRLYHEFATDAKVQSMSEAMQRRFIMLLCLRCSNDLVTLQDDEIAFALHIDEAALAETKALFVRKKFIDDAWNFRRWDERQYVSDSSAARVAKHRANKKAASKQDGNVTVTPPDTDTDTDSDTEKKPTPADADDVRRCPIGTIVDLYHELMPLNPQVKVLNESRKAAIRARWNEAAKLESAPFGYTTRAAGIAAWRRFFEVCSESLFLTGRAPAGPGKTPFIADIEFLFSPSGFAKTLENKYHRDAP